MSPTFAFEDGVRTVRDFVVDADKTALEYLTAKALTLAESAAAEAAAVASRALLAAVLAEAFASFTLLVIVFAADVASLALLAAVLAEASAAVLMSMKDWAIKREVPPPSL
jgi:hypothetical protein